MLSTSILHLMPRTTLFYISAWGSPYTPGRLDLSTSSAQACCIHLQSSPCLRKYSKPSPMTVKLAVTSPKARILIILQDYGKRKEP